MSSKPKASKSEPAKPAAKAVKPASAKQATARAAAKPASKSAAAKSAAAKPAAAKPAAKKLAGRAPQPAPVADVQAVDLRPIVEAMRKRLPKARHAEAEAFAQAFYKRMSGDEMPQHAADGWAALAADFLDFARDRKPGNALVRLFNPQLKSHGWESPHTVLQIANDDMPFLVDSVTMALADQGIGVHVLGHPVVAFRRDKAGKLAAVGEGQAESLMHLELDRQTPEAMAQIQRALETVLADVRAIVRDWAQMRERMNQVAEALPNQAMPIDEDGKREAQAFLRWAADNHFTFLGYREYEVVEQGGESVLRAIKDSGLGLLRGKSPGKPRALTSLAAHYMPQSGSVDALILTKTNARSTVHRPGYMDYIGVLSFDAQGRPTGEKRFLGLYTSSAYNRRPWDIPLVRQRHGYVMQHSGLPADSHSGKALRHVLETLPRDELFQSGEEELLKTTSGILGLQERVRSKLFLRRDRYGRYFSVLVYIPRERFNTDVRLRVEAMLKDRLHGEHVDTTVHIGESPLAQVHLIVRPKSGEAVEVDNAAIEAQLAEIVRNRQDDLREALVRNNGEQQGLALIQRYGRALPPGYIDEVSAGVAAQDIAHLAALTGPEDLRLSLCRTRPGEGGLRFKFYRQLDDIPLSDALPMMENMGLRVISEHPYRLTVDAQPVYIQDFEVETANNDIDVDRLDENFEEAFAQIWRGNAENDGFNRLILAASLSWRQVAMLRAYCKYLLQVGVPFSQSYVEETFARYPLLARLLVELFEARFDPSTGSESKAEIKAGQERLKVQFEALHSGEDAVRAALEPVIAARAGKREAQAEAAVTALKSLLDRVSSLDEDRILRSFIGAINATLRTSYYQRASDGSERGYVSYKFDSAQVPDLPKPKPYREIFVYGPRVEGVHLRFGPVARGGLRWSDRREDFRTEVLGLVKAQMVKNTVIVPVGSKGGFFAKRPPLGGDRDAVLAEGIACYKMFINGLLDITDNIVDGKIVPPRDVVRHDNDDPYLVVAADKGTATFSDIANGIAAEHKFWLDDAFASGGSVGYDHKGMGITAKGAWESVKRHFRALGRDSQTQDFTAVGIGDMSGDVFGNGMLLSEHIRLVAAFDHRHIFLDPNPDAARSFKERDRMFKLPRSSWEDYDKALISKGGGVFARSAKSIPLSAEARAALGIEGNATALSPAELMSAILKAPVDLLWNGGIGTYVKASSESNGDVGDRANNALRVNGADLRCKMVGEGGNLGLTQLGRIEAAQHGVLLNTDFIDNSAGVDTSDHEVNIKILLNGQVQAKKLTLPERNKLLASMTDEVAELVLNDNYRQNQAISLMERMSLTRLGSKLHFIRTLESQGLLDRQIEFLPSDAEIAERKARGQGLTRPELSVLLSYSKLVAFQQMLDSDVPEDPYLSKELVRYFPQPLQAKYAKAMENHRLKREIIATAVTNSTINRMGATFLLRMQEDSGRTPGEVAKAFTITRETLDARELWAQIDALDGKVAESTQIDALQVIWNLQRSFTRWLLSRPGAIPDITTAVERYHDGFKNIRAGHGILGDGERPTHDAAFADWKAKGVPEALAAQLAALPYLEPSCDIIELARERKLKPVDVAKVHFRLGEALRLPWLQEQIDALAVDGRWHAVARGVLREELSTQQRVLVGQVLKVPGANAEAKVKQWLSRDDQSLRFTLAMLTELAAQKTLDYPTASVAVQRLSQLAARG
ncbi:bacterial NAD-glutamate dehydrogenase family protein [Lysobacter enzymogenes]|uniref:Bacterial NAD-glutamate dehydrogenase family protein n=1 Tax=Lysobacter enzymogenes TaxID=69 RepID=A0A0S2DHC0_LYSEN|nr:NAD-glutamate dehydrogenase domain-containing protein [Lysobacter enzymogenes]ALN58039.1 bacterial NAD-glutamate dehydrogenase family protein [Lysobacter enzymogenes]